MMQLLLLPVTQCEPLSSFCVVTVAIVAGKPHAPLVSGI